MEWGLLWTPLLLEIFDLRLLNNLDELVQRSSVNKLFRAYFRYKESTIYLNFLKDRLTVACWGRLTLACWYRLTTRELGLLLQRGVELFRPGEVPMGILGVLNNPRLLSLLPSEDEYPEKTEHLLYYTKRHDNDLTYRRVFETLSVRTLNMKEETTACIRQNSLKCFEVLLDHMPDRVNRVYQWAIKACHFQHNHALALKFMVKYVTLPTAGTTKRDALEELFRYLGDKNLWYLFKYPSSADKMPDYLRLVGWVLERLSRNTFWAHPMIYSMAAGASQQTLEQLAGLLDQTKDLVSLRKIFLHQKAHYGSMCSKEEFPVVCARIESLWQ